MPKLGEFLFGKKAKTKQAKTVTPEQEQLMALINQGLTSGEGPLKDIFGGFNEKEFEKGVSEPALKNFKDKILPLLNEKFIAGNQVGGSGQRDAQLGAATDLQSNLAQLMYQAQQQQKQNRLTGLHEHLGRNTLENIHNQEREGFLPGVWKAFAGGLGQSAGGAAAGFGGFGGGGTGGGFQAAGGNPSMAANAAKVAVG